MDADRPKKPGGRVMADHVRARKRNMDYKKRFLTYELGLLSLKAALSTRDDAFPIYHSGRKLHQRTEAKKAFRELLTEVERRYDAQITEADHIEFIENAANDLSKKLKNDLHNGRFRIGVTQKLINLHLKYLWTAGLCPEPPHCPIDGIIRDEAGIHYNWTQSDCIKEYEDAVHTLKAVASKLGKTLSQWELEVFRRREDKL
jgi:hypothetical protein